MKELICIIIPVYNADRYLDKCLKSIENQTYKNFEVILVNDGSTDQSLRICEEICFRDNRFSVYSIENGGPSAARNFGLKKCRANLITYIDSDDYVAKDYLEALITLRKKYMADISAVGLVKTNGKIDDGNKKYENQKIVVLSGKDAVKDMLYQKHIDTSPCAILFEKKIALSNPFPEGRYHEDDFTMYKYYEMCEMVVIDCTPRYFYLQHDNSIMHSNGVINYDEIDAADNLVNHFSEQGEELLKAALSKKFSDYCQVLIKCSQLKHTDKSMYNKISEFLVNNARIILEDDNTRQKNKIAARIIKLGGVKSLVIVSKLLFFKFK